MKRLVALVSAGVAGATLYLAGCTTRPGPSDASPTCHPATSTPAARSASGNANGSARVRTTGSPGTVTISGRRGEVDLSTAYRLLVAHGLRVAFTQPASLSALHPAMVSWPPSLSKGVPRGSVVELRPVPGGVGSPAVPASHHRYRVPNLVGCQLTQAVNWASDRSLDWTIPRLTSPENEGSPDLFDAYRVVGQTPTPGTSLEPGVSDGASYRVTPLTLTVVATST